ncbi:hypothetical protein Tco_0905001 [Tanacetum coccineum]
MRGRGRGEGTRLKENLDCRDTIQLEDAVSTISQEYLQEFASEYYIPESLHPELPGPEDNIVDFPEEIDLFNLINAPNPLKVKTEALPRLSHESPLDFSNEESLQLLTEGDKTETQVPAVVAPKVPQAAAMRPLLNKRRRKRDEGEAEANAPPKVLRKDHASVRPQPSTSAVLQSVSEPDPLSHAQPQPLLEQDIAQSSKKASAAKDPDSEKSISFTSIGGPPEDIYQPGWGVTNKCRLDTLEACQDMVDHIVPPWYFLVLRHLPNDDFLGQYNVNLARKVAIGSQLRLMFEQEAKLLKKAVAQEARRDQRIQAREVEIKNLKVLLEAEADMKKAAEAKNAELSKELDSLHIQLSDLQVSNKQLTQQVSTLQGQVTGEEKIKATFEEFKKYEDDRVTSRCVEIDARLDTLSIYFDEELYPHMLTAIAGRRWVIGHGMCLAMMKCAESMELRQMFSNVVSAGIAKGIGEGLKHGVEHGKAKLDLAAVEAYDPEADDKFTMALQALKDLEYPLVDHMERLKDAPIDLIMASLHLESDTGEDAPQFIRDLHPSSSQLKTHVYPEVRDPKDPWAFEEEILLEDAIAANISRAEKKKKSRVVCRTHGVSSAHHAKSDGVPVSVPTVATQGPKILLVDAATQTEVSEDKGSPRLLRSKSLPHMFNLEWL